MEYNIDETMYCRNCGKMIREDEMRYQIFVEIGENTYRKFLCENCGIRRVEAAEDDRITELLSE